MSRKVQHRLRLTILVATGLLCLIRTGYYIYLAALSYIDGEIMSFLVYFIPPIIFFVLYLVSIRSSVKIDSYPRAVGLFFLALGWFIWWFVFEWSQLRSCVRKILTIGSLITILIVITEVVVTWRLRSDESRTPLKEAVVVSPNEQQHSYDTTPVSIQEYQQQYPMLQYPPSYQQFNPGQSSHSVQQNPFLQPAPGMFVSSTPKYEDEGLSNQQKQQQPYQQHQQHTFVGPAPEVAAKATL
ncbi:hypothetical protein BGZ94_005227 [Podila epigama]|nr:hypothetical protein BGZ94_005227 [Podila epigama]